MNYGLMCHMNQTIKLIFRNVSNKHVNSARNFSVFRPLTRSSGNQDLRTEDLNLENNPYYKKYGDKIKKLQQQNPDDFIARVQELSEKKKPNRELRPTNVSNTSTETSSLNLNASQFTKRSPSYTQPKGLDSIVKLEKLKDLTAEEIGKIWKQYHQNKDSLCAIIPADTYKKMYNRSLECPNFIYPVARKDGYEFILGQLSGNSCYFTQLLNYQAFKEEAPVCLTLNHFTELESEKGIVLMSGELDTNAINAVDAQFLANQVQLYYGSSSLRKKGLLWTFNKEPSSFDHTDVINEIESTTIV